MTSERPDFELEMTAIADLKPHSRNYRGHPDDQIEHLMASIEEHGFYRNIVIANDGTILAGHGVVVAAKKMGFESLPVIRLPIDANDPRALKVLAGDNEVARLGMIDDRALSEILKEIKDLDAGLLGTGYDEMMLANLVYVTRPESEIVDFDEAAHWVGMPEFGGESRALHLNIHFHNEEDRQDLLSKLGIGKGSNLKQFSKGDTMSLWWPPEKDDDLMSVRFERKD